MMDDVLTFHSVEEFKAHSFGDNVSLFVIYIKDEYGFAGIHHFQEELKLLLEEKYGEYVKALVVSDNVRFETIENQRIKVLEEQLDVMINHIKLLEDELKSIKKGLGK